MRCHHKEEMYLHALLLFSCFVLLDFMSYMNPMYWSLELPCLFLVIFLAGSAISTSFLFLEGEHLGHICNFLCEMTKTKRDDK